MARHFPGFKSRAANERKRSGSVREASGREEVVHDSRQKSPEIKETDQDSSFVYHGLSFFSSGLTATRLTAERGERGGHWPRRTRGSGS